MVIVLQNYDRVDDDIDETMIVMPIVMPIMVINGAKLIAFLP